MKRIGNLWPRVTSFENLLEASRRASAGKRTRGDVAAFQLNLETEMFQLQRELEGGAYQPGPYRSFLIDDPKPKMIHSGSTSLVNVSFPAGRCEQIAQFSIREAACPYLLAETRQNQVDTGL